jgi:outer membrane protein
MLEWLGARLGWAVLGVLLSFAGPAAAAETAPAGVAAPVVIIVDVPQAQRDSIAGKALIAQRDKYQQKFQAEFNAARQQLQASDQDLAKQKNMMSPEAFDLKAKGLEQQFIAFQRHTQVAIRALEKSTDTASTELMNNILAVTGDVASEMGATLVLPKHLIVLHDPRMDVTPLVIERLNKKLPTINFPVPVIEETGAAPAAVKPAPAPAKK